MEHRIPWLGAVMKVYGWTHFQTLCELGSTGSTRIDIVRSMILGHSAGGHMALMMAAVAERKPWLSIAQSQSQISLAADHAKLSDGGDAVRRWMGCPPEEHEILGEGLILLTILQKHLLL